MTVRLEIKTYHIFLQLPQFVIYLSQPVLLISLLFGVAKHLFSWSYFHICIIIMKVRFLIKKKKKVHAQAENVPSYTAPKQLSFESWFCFSDSISSLQNDIPNSLNSFYLRGKGLTVRETGRKINSVIWKASSGQEAAPGLSSPLCTDQLKIMGKSHFLWTPRSSDINDEKKILPTPAMRDRGARAHGTWQRQELWILALPGSWLRRP